MDACILSVVSSLSCDVLVVELAFVLLVRLGDDVVVLCRLDC